MLVKIELAGRLCSDMTLTLRGSRDKLGEAQRGGTKMAGGVLIYVPYEELFKELGVFSLERRKIVCR